MKSESNHANELTCKQYIQLMKLCKEFQPYEKFDEVVFLKVITAARAYCDLGIFPFYTDKERRFNKLFIGEHVKNIRDRYYFDGIKPNGRHMESAQYVQIRNYKPVISVSALRWGNDRPPIETVLFVKVVRACRDYMRSRMSKDAEPRLRERLDVVMNAMNRDLVG